MKTPNKTLKRLRKAPTPTGKIPPQARAALAVLQALGGVGTSHDIYDHPSFRAERKTIGSLARFLALLGANKLIERRGKRFYVTVKANANGAPTEVPPVQERGGHQLRHTTPKAETSITLRAGSDCVLSIGGHSVRINCVR
jgi:hypothetical protein